MCIPAVVLSFKESELRLRVDPNPINQKALWSISDLILDISSGYPQYVTHSHTLRSKSTIQEIYVMAGLTCNQSNEIKSGTLSGMKMLLNQTQPPHKAQLSHKIGSITQDYWWMRPFQCVCKLYRSSVLHYIERFVSNGKQDN